MYVRTAVRPRTRVQVALRLRYPHIGATNRRTTASLDSLARDRVCAVACSDVTLPYPTKETYDLW
jgi:hypothetical protein